MIARVYDNALPGRSPSEAFPRGVAQVLASGLTLRVPRCGLVSVSVLAGPGAMPRSRCTDGRLPEQSYSATLLDVPHIRYDMRNHAGRGPPRRRGESSGPTFLDKI
jgi:hypothetical protein